MRKNGRARNVQPETRWSLEIPSFSLRSQSQGLDQSLLTRPFSFYVKTCKVNLQVCRILCEQVYRLIEN